MKRVALLCAFLALLSSCSPPPAGSPVRHVVFISMDTARADHFGFMGSPDAQTPRLDALARESIVFTDYMSVVPTTLASHVTLLTGKYPHHHGTARNGFMVNRENEMLPEILSRASFHTAGFAAAFSLDSRFDFAQGFDHYDEEFDILADGEDVSQNQRSASAVTNAAINYLDGTGVPRHLFLFAHYFDPHRPYSAPAPFDIPSGEVSDDELPPVFRLKRDPRIPEADRLRYARRYEEKYRAEISYMDHHIGRLLDDLRERGILDDALLVVTSDHGESLWEHGEEFDHGYSVFQSTLHAVCMIRFPNGERGGTMVDDVVASIDVLPTVLNFLGIDTPAGVDGEAVALGGGEQGVTTSVDAEVSAPGRVRYAQATKPTEELENDPRWANIAKSRCLREGRHKYIQTPYWQKEELYDVISDPAETLNLLGAPTPEQAELTRRFRRELEQWVTLADPLPSRFESSQKDETIERLKSLGYLN